MAGKQGFEPRFHDPESCVLPLDDFPARSDIIIDLAMFFKLAQPWDAVLNYQLAKYQKSPIL